MEKVDTIVDACTDATDKIVGVSKELIGYIGAFDANSIKEKIVI